MAVIRHHGPHDSALGEYATRHEISVEGPLREYYDRFSWDRRRFRHWVTALCWPVFRADA